MARTAVTITTTGQTFTNVSDSTLAVLQRVYGSELRIDRGHSVSVVRVGGRYPYRPVCTCGQEFRGYAVQHAAQIVADDHSSI